MSNERDSHRISNAYARLEDVAKWMETEEFLALFRQTDDLTRGLLIGVIHRLKARADELHEAIKGDYIR